METGGSQASGAAGGLQGSGDTGTLAAHLLTSPDEAINVFDFQEMARAVLPPAHYGYLATGVDGDETLHANREGFGRFQLRPRRLVDVSEIDMSVELLGERWPTPIVLCPVGSQRAFHDEGELAVARASSARNHLQILSTVTTTSVEEVNEVRDRPVWYQLYPTSSWDVTQALVRRARAAGCDTLVLTVDLPVDSNRETLARAIRQDDRDCTECHRADPDPQDPMRFPTGWLDRKPMFDGLDMSSVDFATPAMTWDFIGRLRDITDMRILIKGIMRGDDALQCVRVGADGLVVSNHGGRADPSGRSTIESLPEVISAVNGRMPVLIDGGIRRGSDILKALAMGADAVCIGRPYVWGLAAFGQPGVEKVLELLTEELRIAMQLNGVRSISRLDLSYVTPA
jgi:isopentenyl diphosphate isomerase/L-lactate dehydrogenase-like FMN-dependent dehydrogenase